MNRSSGRRLIAVVLVIALGLPMVTACGPTVDQPPAAQVEELVRLQVELQDVRSTATEDNLGDDEFYVVGGSALAAAVNSNGAPQGAISEVIDVGSNDEWMSFGAGKVLFAGSAPGRDSVHLGAIAYDEDTAKDWGDRLSWLVSLAGLLAEYGKANGWARAGAVVAAALVAIVSLDSDDELGRIDLDIPLRGPAEEVQTWTIDHDGGFLGSSYHYEIRILITRS